MAKPTKEMNKLYGIIYKITNLINGKVYIGQTIQGLKQRWKQHKNHSKYHDFLLYRAMKKYGNNNFKIEQIDVAYSKEQLDAKESYWIEKYNCLSPNGYNCLSGPTGTPKVCEITRKKLSKASKRMWKNPEYRKKISKALKGKKLGDFTEEHKEKISKSLTGRTLTNEHRKKIGRATRKLWEDEKYRKACLKPFQEYNNKQKKKVINLDTGKIFESINDAARFYNLPQQNISKVLHGKRKRCGSYRWAFYMEVI